jgi:[acyl-carrier-protein] S-malonyltransferase
MATLGINFPGQGSQHVGMLAGMAQSYPQVQATFAEASDVLSYDLWELVQTGPAELLALTHITQPAVLTSSVALWRIWQATGGLAPVLMAGHSLGEYSALVCAGVIGFADAVALVRQRGEFMQSAVPVGMGAMAAIVGLDDELVISACQQASGQEEVVAAVNFNSPGQVVIAGHSGAVAKAMALCKTAGAKRALPLPVSAPFHSPLMQPAAEQFAKLLADIAFNEPAIEVIQNYGLKCSRDVEEIRRNLVLQIYHPVPWVDTIRQFAARGVTTLVELGPGRVLTGLNKRIDSTLHLFAVNDPAGLMTARQALGEG